MAIKIVTDSGSDLSPAVASALGISIVPVYIYFGDTAYKDGIDIGPDELYKKLVDGPVHPTTTQPMPSDFTTLYEDISRDADAIVSIHLSSKVSGTYNSAIQAVDMVKSKCEIHVVDSYSLSAGLGLIVMAAVQVANAGGKLNDVLEATRNAVKQTQIYGLLDTLQYLLKGGRITKTKALVGTLLNVKPILTLRKGELVQAGMARSYVKGIDKLLEFLKKYPNLKKVGIAHSTVPEEAENLRKSIASIIGEEHIQMSRIGAGLGVHGGPGVLMVAAQS